MNPNMFSGLKITSLLNGANRVLNFANQAIPLYKNLKPFIDNSKSIMSILNIMNAKDIKEDKKEEIKKESVDGLPTFFQ